MRWSVRAFLVQPDRVGPPASRVCEVALGDRNICIYLYVYVYVYVYAYVCMYVYIYIYVYV